MRPFVRPIDSTRAFASCAAFVLLSLGVACSGSDGADVVGDSGPATGDDASAASPDGGTSPSEDGGDAGSTKHDSGSADGAAAADADGAHDDAAATSDGGLDPSVAPGGNFDLSVWELQEPVGSPGSPTTFVSSQLVGPNGHQDTYFFTDPTDGSMSFWDPENGVTTANSNYPRSELREMTAAGAAANWLPPGTHTLSATVKATLIPSHVAVGQIHLGTGTPSSTKPLLELFYASNGDISMNIEQTPAGGNEIPYPAGNVPLGTPWSYVIGLSGNTISLVVNGGTPQTWTMSSTFDQEGMYFKAGDYDQSVGADGTVGAKVQFYALQIFHGP
jgi:hypothetical protein